MRRHKSVNQSHGGYPQFLPRLITGPAGAPPIILAVLVFLGFSAPVEAGLFFQDEANFDCKQRPDSISPNGEHWYYHLGDNGKPCWRLKPWARSVPVRPGVRSLVARKKPAGEQRTKPVQPASLYDQSPAGSGESPEWAVPYALMNQDLEPSTGRESPTVPSFLERWQPDANPVQASNADKSLSAEAAPITEPDATQPAVQLAEARHQGAWDVISFGALILSAAFGAALIFKLAALLRQRKELQTLIGRDEFTDDIYSLPMEVKLVPDFVEGDAFTEPETTGRGRDTYYPLDNSNHPMAIYVPVKYRDQFNGTLDEPSIPDSPEYQATLTDLLRRLRRSGAAQ